MDAPYRLPVGGVLRSGQNELIVEVTNTWVNRLIGDARLPEHFDGYRLETYRNGNLVELQMPAWYSTNQPPPPGPRQTFTTAPFYDAEDELQKSGLLGEVWVGW